MKNIAPQRLASALALSLAAATVQAAPPLSVETAPGQLPTDVVPLQYAAHLIPDFAAQTFLGAETVEIEVLTSTSVLMLNAVDLEIDAANLSGKGIGDLKLAARRDKEGQTLSFHLETALAPGRYHLALKFHGLLDPATRGLFSMNDRGGNVDQAMLASGMAPSDARRMLPSWDAPSFLAKFKLTVDVPAAYQAFSNMPVEKRDKLEGGLQRISFGMTPRMPSYLLVLVAGERARVGDAAGGADGRAGQQIPLLLRLRAALGGSKQ